MEYIYRDLYNFQVLDELEEGNKVCVLDKQTSETRDLTTMMVLQLMQLLAKARDEETRYLFWKVVEIEGAKEDAEL